MWVCRSLILLRPLCDGKKEKRRGVSNTILALFSTCKHNTLSQPLRLPCSAVTPITTIGNVPTGPNHALPRHVVCLQKLECLADEARVCGDEWIGMSRQLSTARAAATSTHELLSRLSVQCGLYLMQIAMPHGVSVCSATSIAGSVQALTIRRDHAVRL